MNGPARIIGAAGVAGALSLTTPPVQTATTDVVQTGAPSDSTSQVGVPTFTSANWSGSGLLPGIGYSNADSSTLVAGQDTQFATLAGGLSIGGSASPTTGTVSDQPVGTSSVLSFSVASGSGPVSQGSDVSPGGTAAAPQLVMTNFNSGATALSSVAASAQSSISTPVGTPGTPDPVPTGTMTPLTLAAPNQQLDLSFDNLPTASPNLLIAPATVRIMSVVNSVPEPAMLAVLGVGLVGLGAVRRRKIG